MSGKYNFALILYEGPATARVVFNNLTELRKARDFEVKEAAIFSKGVDGKIDVQNLGFIGTSKGGALGLLIGAVVAGAPLAGLAIGGLVGFARSGERRRLRSLLVDELDETQSALAIVVRRTDWATILDVIEGEPGEVLVSDISDEALAALDAAAEGDPKNDPDPDSE